MKVFNFKTYDDFLERFDGKIYSIANDYDNYLCDLHEEDIDEFVKSKKMSYLDGDYYITHQNYKQDILSEAIYINIR
jgi:hypothetical protein